MRILRAKDYRRMPWKNGGGETTEIAISPEGAALDEFDWRVSMAAVASDGPFSLFPNIDRTLAILSGNGIRLRVDGIGTIDLTQASAPFAFPADAAAGADLLDGPIVDLNVMSRRGVLRHTLVRRDITARCRLQRNGNTMLVLVQDDIATIQTGALRVSLDPGDSVLLDNVDETEAIVTPAGRLTLYMADFCTD
jgi:environmental stress-induced protein Ves